jgi:hypothetical protein
MPYAKSLRAIGQSLEMLRVQTFWLEKEGDSYLVWSQSLTGTRQWILKNNLAENVSDSETDQETIQLTRGDGWICYEPLAIARLDARGQRKRQNLGFAQMRGDKLSQLLRTLGEYLDKKEATVFHISWAADSVSVDYQIPDGVRERKHFTVERLRQLALHSRFRRSHRNALIGPPLRKPANSF